MPPLPIKKDVHISIEFLKKLEKDDHLQLINLSASQTPYDKFWNSPKWKRMDTG